MEKEALAYMEVLASLDGNPNIYQYLHIWRSPSRLPTRLMLPLLGG